MSGGSWGARGPVSLPRQPPAEDSLGSSEQSQWWLNKDRDGGEEGRLQVVQEPHEITCKGCVGILF